MHSGYQFLPPSPSIWDEHHPCNLRGTGALRVTDLSITLLHVCFFLFTFFYYCVYYCISIYLFFIINSSRIANHCMSNICIFAVVGINGCTFVNRRILLCSFPDRRVCLLSRVYGIHIEEKTIMNSE